MGDSGDKVPHPPLEATVTDWPPDAEASQKDHDKAAASEDSATPQEAPIPASAPEQVPEQDSWPAVPRASTPSPPRRNREQVSDLHFHEVVRG